MRENDKSNAKLRNQLEATTDEEGEALKPTSTTTE